MTATRDRDLCSLVDRWLDDWLAGSVPSGIRSRLDEHVRSCARCRRLLALAQGKDGDDAPAGDEEGVDLAAAVIARTSGGACARAEEWLPMLVDGEVDADTRAILDVHLSHCRPCNRLRTTLETAREVLPSLAEMQPPLGFAERVLAATSRAPQPVGVTFGLRASIEAFGRWWLRVLARPRASLELAYVGALLIVIVFGTDPVAAFRGATDRASELAGRVPVSRLAEQLPKDAAVGVAGRVMASVVSAADAVASELAYRWQQVRAIVAAIQAAFGDLWKWITTIDVRQWVGNVRQAFQPPSKAPPPAETQPKAPGGTR